MVFVHHIALKLEKPKEKDKKSRQKFNIEQESFTDNWIMPFSPVLVLGASFWDGKTVFPLKPWIWELSLSQEQISVSFQGVLLGRTSLDLSIR